MSSELSVIPRDKITEIVNVIHPYDKSDVTCILTPMINIHDYDYYSLLDV